MANLICTLAAWRSTQGIYRFDSALFDALCATPVTGELPTEVLRRLPEWAVYIETPGLRWEDEALIGAFAHVELLDDDNEGLTLVLNMERAMYMCLLRLDVPTIEDALDVATEPGSPPESIATMRDMLPRLVSLVLYLCSEEPDFGAAASPVAQARPQPKRIGKGWRMMPARRATQWEVGTRLGAALRRAWHEAESAQSAQTAHGQHAAPRAHIRRAHWHTFLKGPRQQPVRQIRWLPPIAVNVSHPDALVQTVRPVRDDR